jgi:hypothetical protein
METTLTLLVAALALLLGLVAALKN